MHYIVCKHTHCVQIVDVCWALATICYAQCVGCAVHYTAVLCIVTIASISMGRTLLPRIWTGIVHNYPITCVSILGNNGKQFGMQLQGCVKLLYSPAVHIAAIVQSIWHGCQWEEVWPCSGLQCHLTSDSSLNLTSLWLARMSQLLIKFIAILCWLWGALSVHGQACIVRMGKGGSVVEGVNGCVYAATI